MREIKFRAWDKKDKVMREVYGIQFPKISNHGNRQNTIIEMHCSDYEGQKAIILSDFTDSVDRVELMQFTGLIDKNKKEIYEGDIIQKENKNYIVTWDDGSFGIFRNGDWADYLLGHCGSSEVIGNIYENPELLNKEI